jgi:hypothetical protein
MSKRFQTLSRQVNMITALLLVGICIIGILAVLGMKGTGAL